MTLRVEDLKRQDIVRVEYYVSDLKGERAWLTPLAGSGWDMVGHITIGVNDKALAALNAEKVVRARPVRKGDEIVSIENGVTGQFVALFDGDVVWHSNPYDITSGGRRWFIHADGSPIDWEASE